MCLHYNTRFCLYTEKTLSMRRHGISIQRPEKHIEINEGFDKMHLRDSAPRTLEAPKSPIPNPNIKELHKASINLE